jgi:hypothetical protein
MMESMDEAVLGHLARLRPIAPDAARANRVRVRCRRLLERPQRHRATRASRRRLFEAAIVGALAIVYLAMVMQSALAMYVVP